MNIQADVAPSESPPRKRHGNAEARIQAAVVDYIRVAAPQCFVCHIANGGLRSKSEAALFKWMGVVAGVPDLLIIAPGGRAYFLEVKAAAGSLSDVQKSTILELAKRGAFCKVVRGIDDVRSIFRLWGIATRESA